MTVRLEFDKELQAVSAALGGSALALTQTADASVWTGDVVVPVTSELTVGLVVKTTKTCQATQAQKIARIRCQLPQRSRSEPSVMYRVIQQ